MLWNFIKNKLELNEKVVLMIVAESSNSSPGRQGFKMAVSENGETAGTIGGGLMEKELIDYAIDLLFGKESRQIRKLHHNPQSPGHKSGLICGGYQTLIIKVLDKNNLLTIKNILTNIKKNEDGFYRRLACHHKPLMVVSLPVPVTKKYVTTRKRLHPV